MNNKQYVGRRVSSIEVYDEIGPITGVALLLDEENEILAGNDKGYVLEVNCPYGTQEMADNILAKVSGHTYKGFRAQGAKLDPTAELGDGVTVDGNYSMLAYRNVNFGSGHMSEIAAPGESTLEHEFNYQSPSKRENNRKEAKTKALIEKTAELFRVEVAGTVERVENAEDDIAALDKTAGELRDDVDAVEERVTKFEVSLDGVSAEVTNNKNAVTALDLELGNIETRVQDAEGNISKVTQKVDSFTIEVSSGSTTAQIKLKAGDTVVGSGTIEMTGLVSFTGLENGTTTINGGCLATGKIQDKTGNTYWDLDEGEMVLHNAEIRTLAVKTFLAADYTSDDLTAVQKIVNGTVTPTTAQIERYDINCDGQVDNADYARLYFIVNSQQNVTVTWKYCVDPADRTNTLSLIKEETVQYSDGTSITTESVIFAAGAGRVKTNFLDVIGGMSVSGDVKAYGDVTASGTVHADGGFTAENGWTVMHGGNSGVGLLSLPDNLTSSNTTATVTYPAGTVGFHVYGYPISGASMVGTFIPLSLCNGTSFQLADDGNYVTFTMTADTSARALTITRTGGAGWITSVHPLYFGSTT